MNDEAAKRARNREMWDDRVPAHVASDFYDIDGFRAGRTALRPFEIADVGPVEGLELVHLQCHFGLDTLSWARLGARVTGVDFSEAAVEAARALAAETGIDAEFVASDVYDAVDALDGRDFDIVYTGLGALNWLPDLERWAAVVDRLLRPGGLAYVPEFHPVHGVFADDDLTVEFSYWTEPEGLRFEADGSYVETEDHFEHTESWEWIHPLSRVIGALLDRGLVLEAFHELPYTLFRRWPFLELHGDGTWWLPEGMPELPLMYTLKLRKPS